MYSSANECQNFVSHKVDDTLALYHMLLRLALPSAGASPRHDGFRKNGYMTYAGRWADAKSRRVGRD
jgi:hypothetical protein